MPYPSSTKVMATKGMVSSMSQQEQQVLDMRALSGEQGLRVGWTFAVAKFLEDFAHVIYTYSSGSEPAATKEFQGWTLSWRRGPSPRIQVRFAEPKFGGLVKATLQALTYEVRDKGDHMVVIL